ncbi:50S ribosomal protein L13 [Halobacteriales archaeon QS_9_67_15]|nr:MAG: 50S ribosomal protein L13 [Halobacteriales archaeon QS_9_67_15]
MSLAEFDADVVVDARDCILGRVASKVATRALEGETVAVVNAERAVVTGSEQDVIGTFEQRRELGSDRGPAYPKRPDGIMKRSIRGMVPHKTSRGREAFGDGDGEAVEADVLEGTSLDRLSSIKFVTLGDVSEALGANKTW